MNNPNVTTILKMAVVSAMQKDRLMTPEAQAQTIIGSLHLALTEIGERTLVSTLCGPQTGMHTVDQIAAQVVDLFLQGRPRIQAWEALGYESLYVGEGNNLLMSGQSAVESVYVN